MRVFRFFEEELDEMLLVTNPQGGRPKEIGSTVWTEQGEEGMTYDVAKVREESTRRFMLGYCACARKIVIGPKRAEVIAEALRRAGVKAAIPVVPVRLRLARLLARGIRGA